MPRIQPPDPSFSSLWFPGALKTASSEPKFLIADRASGIEILDANGRHFVDATSSLGSNIHGYRCALINQAIKDQLHRIANTRYLSTTAHTLADRLVAIAPAPLAHVVLAPSGPAALENSLATAERYQIANRRPERRSHLLFRLPSAPESDALTGSFSDRHPIVVDAFSIALFNSALDMHKDRLCAIVVEPAVSWRNGVQIFPSALLANISQRCRELDILLIADESASGFGRTGAMFACEQERLVPDLLCCGSVLTGGHLPLGATLVSQAVFDRVDALPADALKKPPLQVSAEPLACAAALASLDIFERDRILPAIPGQIEVFRRALDEFVAHSPEVLAIRQCGMMAGIELQPDDATVDGVGLATRVLHHAREGGLDLYLCGQTIVLMPPLMVSAADLRRLLRSIASAISQSVATTTNDRDAAAPAVRAPRPLRQRGLLVLGTDTNVGKTMIGRAILRMAARAGKPVIPVKPTESGCDPTPVDAEALRRASRLDLPIERVCPFPFSPPVAPAVAAEMTGQALTLAHLVDACKKARPQIMPHQPILVESAGGLLSPLTATETNADLAAKLGLPILLVSRNGLGTINHTALCIGELRRRGLNPAALILVDTDGKDTPDRGHNARSITSLTGIVPVGMFPYLQKNSAADEDDALAVALEASCDTSAIWQALLPDS